MKKNYFWRYDTKIFKTKKAALDAVGKKEHYSNVQKYYRAKNSITKEFYYGG